MQWEDRATNAEAVVVHATTNEIQRASSHNADPEVRFHYRYQAAFLAWEAAKLMPNNNDETAMILWAGGTWLKNRDPETADLFYKALVNRNRRTELGEEADRQRWFPKLDENGHPIPEAKPAPVPPEELDMEPGTIGEEEPGPNDEAAASQPGQTIQTAGYDYFINKGDTLASIALPISESRALPSRPPTS